MGILSKKIVPGVEFLSENFCGTGSAGQGDTCIALGVLNKPFREISSLKMDTRQTHPAIELHYCVLLRNGSKVCSNTLT